MNDLTLDKAKKGTFLTILSLPGDDYKIQLIRLGLSEGESVKCIERLPGGTIVIQKSRQEIAIGFELARKIRIILQ